MPLINRLFPIISRKLPPRLAEEEQQKRLAEEEQLVFLESSLEFQKEQLRAALERAGEGAEHGLPEACKLNDCEDSFSRTRSA